MSYVVKYSEKVIIPRTKPNITFQGQGFQSTAIVWNDTANSAHGTFYSGSVQVFATNFVAKNISFMVRIIKFARFGRDLVLKYSLKD